MANPDIVGRHIRKVRMARGLTQDQLAELTKLPQSTISQIESGARRGRTIQLNAAQAIAFALQISLDALAGLPQEDSDDEMFPTMAGKA
jgi:transcriptional regulator with XRE-family HTH domain